MSYHGAVRILVFGLLVSGLALMPFVMLKRPWALTIWRRIRWLIVAYAVVIVVSAIVGLIFRWDDIYG